MTQGNEPDARVISTVVTVGALESTPEASSATTTSTTTLATFAAATMLT